MIYNLDLQIDRSEVLRYLGYRSGQTEDSAKVEQLLDEAAARVEQVARAQGLLETFRLQRHLGSLEMIGCDLSLNSADLLDLLQNSSRISLLLVTLGAGVDQLIADWWQQGKYAAAATADAIASDAAEQAMNQLNRQVEQLAACGQLGLTRRFSPGYGDVPLSLQPELLRLLGAEQIGVFSTSEHLLLPQKTITALVGWQPSGDSRAETDKCAACPAAACSYRRQPYQPKGR
jgi:hypothetical protein